VKQILGHARNVALVMLAMTLMSARPARANDCTPSPSGSCICCNDPYPCCFVYCDAILWCDCCNRGGACVGPGC